MQLGTSDEQIAETESSEAEGEDQNNVFIDGAVVSLVSMELQGSIVQLGAPLWVHGIMETQGSDTASEESEELFYISETSDES